MAITEIEAAGSVSLEVFRTLPKADLHVHLDGSLRLETILDLARSEEIDLPAESVAGLRDAIGCGNNFGSLVEYLRGFDITLRVMQTEASLERIAFELAEDAHRENVRYMEVRYAPMLHTRRGLKLTRVVEAVLAGLRRARETYGIKANVIICGIRNISPESSLEMAELAVAYKSRGVVGIRSGRRRGRFSAQASPRGVPAGSGQQHQLHHPRGRGLRPGERSPRRSTSAARTASATAAACVEDGDLLHYMNDHRMPLECCPSSNVQTGAVKDLATHPLKLYFDLGCRVTINTDNRLITDTSVSKELYLVHSQMGVPFSDVKAMIVAGFKSSFQPFHEKQAMLRARGPRSSTVTTTRAA